MSKWVGSIWRMSAVLRLWIDANTCSNRDGRLPTDPLFAERRIPRAWRKVATTLLKDLLAMRYKE